MLFTIDGTEWNIQAQIERTANITPSEISGLLLDKTYFNDIIGTYMEYKITLVVPIGMESEYADLYELLTAPVDAHTCILPYNQTTIEITGRIDVVNDNYYRRQGEVTIWRGTTFTITANHPSKESSLDDVITRGLIPVPDTETLEIGMTYEYQGNGEWVQITLEDLDENYY